jgi:plasmid stabilization system protein ParE
MAKKRTRLTGRQVVWTSTAAKQRNSILKYWFKNNKSNSYSLKLLKLSNRKAEEIAENPEVYRQSEFPNTRIASIGHFSIYYKVDDDVVIITAFWGARPEITDKIPISSFKN